MFYTIIYESAIIIMFHIRFYKSVIITLWGQIKLLRHMYAHVCLFLKSYDSETARALDVFFITIDTLY